MAICERCQKEHDGSFGSGRFCSRACANVREFSFETKEKTSNTLKNKPKRLAEKNCKKCGSIVLASMNVSDIICDTCKIKNCKKCGESFIHKKSKYCSLCRRKTSYLKKDLSELTLATIPGRTVAKILKRANKNKCFICSWNEASCDIHHIIPQALGGSDNHDNLILLCPNCHRTAHNNKFTKEFLFERSIDIIFKNWKDFYFIS